MILLRSACREEFDVEVIEANDGGCQLLEGQYDSGVGGGFRVGVPGVLGDAVALQFEVRERALYPA